MAITSIPEKTRAELYRDKETAIDADFRLCYQHETATQTELTLLSSIYEKVMTNNKACMEMAEDFYYKKELEEEELMKYLADDNKKLQKKSTSKEDVDQIKLKLKEFRLKHKDENADVHKSQEPTVFEKIRGALNKVRALRTLEEGQASPSRKGTDNEELDKMLAKDKEYETEEEESENEARDDDGRQDNIIRELENSEEHTERNNKKDDFEENENLEPKKGQKLEMLKENSEERSESSSNNNTPMEENHSHENDSDKQNNSKNDNQENPVIKVKVSERKEEASSSGIKPRASIRYQTLKIDTHVLEEPSNAPHIRSPSSGSSNK